MLCLILGTLSIAGNYFFKVIIPKNISFSKNGFEYGNFKYYWNPVILVDSSVEIEKERIPMPEA